MPLARISLTLSPHLSLSFIASGRSSGLHPVSSQTCCMYVRAGRPAFARLYVGVHRSTSLMSSSLLLQLCPACLVRLSWIVFVMGGRWPYSWCLMLINWYCAFSKAPALLELPHQIVLCHIRTLVGWSITRLPRCSRCNLQTPTPAD